MKLFEQYVPKFAVRNDPKVSKAVSVPNRYLNCFTQFALPGIAAEHGGGISFGAKPIIIVLD